ncbi:MAG TPA: hypothetical protein PKE52_00085 [Bacteroidales bacterium]|nr:hypothetical protein [Bacteroidales bacterium]
MSQINTNYKNTEMGVVSEDFEVVKLEDFTFRIGDAWPSRQEQTCIATIISDMDAEIHVDNSEHCHPVILMSVLF